MFDYDNHKIVLYGKNKFDIIFMTPENKKIVKGILNVIGSGLIVNVVYMGIVMWKNKEWMRT